MRAIILLASLFISSCAFCQNELDSIVSYQLERTIYRKVEEMPQMPWTKNEFSAFIHKNLQYPKAALKEEIEGTVWVGFIVNEDGSLSDFFIKEGKTKEMNAEALRLARMIPNIKPGKVAGKEVNVIISIPIRFRLDNFHMHKIPEPPKHIPVQFIYRRN